MTHDADDRDRKSVIGSLEREIIELALQLHGGDITKAAQSLEIDELAFRRKMREYGIEPRM
jgi:DNA-binding NtrC family response regulator